MAGRFVATRNQAWKTKRQRWGLAERRSGTVGVCSPDQIASSARNVESGAQVLLIATSETSVRRDVRLGRRPRHDRFHTKGNTKSNISGIGPTSRRAAIGSVQVDRNAGQIAKRSPQRPPIYITCVDSNSRHDRMRPDSTGAADGCEGQVVAAQQRRHKPACCGLAAGGGRGVARCRASPRWRMP
jgi:hypothetical protein